MKKRNDATLALDVPPFVKIFPYLMKRRCDSLIYHKVTIDMTNTVKFIRAYNRENKPEYNMCVFDIVLAAFARLCILRPKLNRFIANYEAWQRNEISFLFVVKESLADDAPEHNAMIKVDSSMTLVEISKLTNEAIEKARVPGNDKATDKLIEKYLKLPKFLIIAAISFFSWLDKHGMLPRAIRDVDGLHSTAVFANLGSINLLSAPFHHLYEWGTTSMFITVGSLYREILNDEKKHTYLLEFGVTIDERIADGLYIIRSLDMFQDFIHKPETLLDKLDKQA